MLTFSTVFAQQSTDDEKLNQAVQSLRNVEIIKYDANNFKGRMQQEESIKASMKGIIDFGEIGAARLKREIELINKSQEKDDFFKLNAASLLWDIGKENEVDTILSIWKAINLWETKKEVLSVAFKAAKTQNEKVVPMMSPLLISHGYSVEFVWGVYGQKGLPVLLDILNNTNTSNYEDTDNKIKAQSNIDKAKVSSAILFLTTAQYKEALPKIRELAQGSNPEVRKWAVKALGIFGHPKDFEVLVKGLQNSVSEDEQQNYLWALCEFNSKRSVPFIIPFLNSHSKNVRGEALYVLTVNPSVESYDALLGYYNSTDAKDDKKYIDTFVISNFIKKNGLTIDSYLGLPVSKKQDLLEKRQKEILKDYILQNSDQKLTHEQFMELTETWIKENRFTIGKVPFRILLHSATPADIPRLLDVRSALYQRHSDECLYEVRYIELLINNLTRRQYREDYITPYMKPIFM